MIDYTGCNIEKIAIHRVGNKTNGEEITLSKSLLDTDDNQLRQLLIKFFLQPLTNAEYHSFTSADGDFKQNPLFALALELFSDSKTFHPASVSIAKQLYELSVHPQIKAGDLFVAYFSSIVNDDELVDAIGIFKSETRQPFLKINATSGDFALLYEDGINIEKLDKGCIILNTHQHDGFKVCIIDKSNKTEAQYWKDDFLSLKPCDDSYHTTKQFMDIAKNFVTTQLKEEFEVSKADQIDLLNRSVDYFKTNDTFDKRDFEKQVFEHPSVIESFRKFDETFSEAHDLDVADTFTISPQAVKKQSKIFKSVLKLDKNFHIYIHGDKELIEKGFDKDKGMNFYKVYFKDEN